jgi:hypothetical protein
MTKEFCDRCGELISDGNYKTGSIVLLNEEGTQIAWQVEVSIKLIKQSCMEKNWKLCTYCADEVMDMANAKRFTQSQIDVKKD